jgi:iron uptake system EfeUOB component EfeO/EfeM
MMELTSESIASLPFPDNLASRDQFDAAMKKLRSLLTMFSGEGFTAFKTLSDDNQQNLIWLASDLADDVARAGQLVAGTRTDGPQMHNEQRG